MKPDSVIVLFMEGDTECEFYKALIDFLRKVNGGRLSSLNARFSKKSGISAQRLNVYCRKT